MQPDDQGEQRDLIDAETVEQQRMKLRGIEQAAVEAGRDQRPCRPGRGDG